jgi:hypothetical protein
VATTLGFNTQTSFCNCSLLLADLCRALDGSHALQLAQLRALPEYTLSQSPPSGPSPGKQIMVHGKVYQKKIEYQVIN